MEKEVKILNGTFEVAMRLLTILSTCSKPMTVERLSAYSYFALYLSDLDKDEESLHPAIPYRNASYINSRDVILQALELLLSKGVAVCDFTNRSIKFSATNLGTMLNAQIEGSYKNNLVNNILKADKLLGHQSDKQLNSLIYGNMAEWGSEYSYESLFKDAEYEE